MTDSDRKRKPVDPELGRDLRRAVSPFSDPEFAKNLQKSISPFSDPEFAKNLQKSISPFSDPEFAKNLQKSISPFSDPEFAKNLQKSISPFSDPEFAKNLQKSISPFSDPEFRERWQRAFAPFAEFVTSNYAVGVPPAALAGLAGATAERADAPALADLEDFIEERDHGAAPTEMDDWLRRLPEPEQRKMFLTVAAALVAVVAVIASGGASGFESMPDAKLLVPALMTTLALANECLLRRGL